MRPSTHHQQRGSVVLVALCFLAVLGIALASYLAVSNQAMKLSNRSYQQSISAQLAEIGIEQTLWAFNWNNWSSWDTTTIPGTATRLVTFPPTKYGNGVLGSIKVRADRWDATVWSGFINYKLSSHDLVWYQGVWYQCIVDDSTHSSPIDSSLKWISAPGPWNSSANYRPQNIVLYGDVAYQCTSPNVNVPPIPTNIPAYWTALGATIGAWNSATNYAVNDIVLLGSMCYRCIASNSNIAPPNFTFWVGAPAIYTEGIAAPPDSPTNVLKTQLRALLAPASLFPNAIAATSTVNFNSSNPLGIIDSYNYPLDPSPTPNTADQFRGYSAIVTGNNTSGSAVKMNGGIVQGYISAPSVTTFPYAPNVSLAGAVKGSATATGIDLKRLNRNSYIPQFFPAVWDSNRGYRVNDVVSVGSDFYLCKVVPTANQDPSDTTYWTKNTALALPSGANCDIGFAGALIPSVYYISFPATGDVDLNGATATITIKGPVIINVPGYFRTRNGGKVIIESTGSAQIFVNGRLRIDGVGGIENQTSNPRKLAITDTATATPGGHSFSTTTPFYGTIYMPFTTGTITFSNFSGSDPVIFGAISAKTITFNSVANFHYDTSLRTATFGGVDAPFMVTEWRELTDPAEKIVLP